MNTYPEMNKQIVALLKASGTTVDLYAAARIEELEKELKELENPPFATCRKRD